MRKNVKKKMFARNEREKKPWAQTKKKKFSSHQFLSLPLSLSIGDENIEEKQKKKTGKFVGI